MADFFGGFKQAWNPHDANNEWLASMAKQFPCLAKAIAGTPGAGRDGWETPPMTIMIYAKEGKLRASVQNPEYPRIFYVAINDPGNPLANIDAALASGTGEWAERRKK